MPKIIFFLRRSKKSTILLLIFIYYYKGILSICDIQTLLVPLTQKYFHTPSQELNLGTIYNEVFSLEKEEIEDLQKDIEKKFATSRETFREAPETDQEILQLFSFISMLSYDVYVKKLLIEKMIDSFKTATAKDND